MNAVLATALLLGAFAADQQAAPIPSAASEQKIAAVARKIAPLLEEAGFKNYRKGGDGLWVIGFKGDNTASVNVGVQARETMVLVFSVVQKETRPTMDQMRGLLRANYDADFSKLAIDNDGDLLSLVELPTDLNSQMLRKAVDQVAALADTAVGLLAVANATTGESPQRAAAGAGATVSLLRGSYELSYDPAKWKVEKTEGNITQLNHVSGEAWVRVIPERIEITPDHFREVVIANAQGVDPNVKMVSETWTTVNGLRADVMRYEAAKAGIKFTFYNQMYSETAGTIQIAAWTPTSLFADYERDFLELFAGLRKAPGGK